MHKNEELKYVITKYIISDFIQYDIGIDESIYDSIICYIECIEELKVKFEKHIEEGNVQDFLTEVYSYLIRESKLLENFVRMLTSRLEYSIYQEQYK